MRLIVQIEAALANFFLFRLRFKLLGKGQVLLSNLKLLLIIVFMKKVTESTLRSLDF